MTDKEQIIIEDMDVSAQECEFWQEGHCDCYHCEDRYPHCLDYPNCYFKQLVRKTQECEELKDKMADVIYAATGGRLSYSDYTLDAIEQAFNDQLEILSDQKVEEELKELNQKLYLAQNEVHSKTEYIQEQREEIKQLEQECEELKERIKAYENLALHIKCPHCNKELDLILDGTEEKISLLDCYRKALEEIEKVCLEDTRTFADGTQMRYDSLDEILDIINKAKGGVYE